MIIRKDQAAVDRGTEEWARKYGASESVHLSDEGGLTRFGANLQTLERVMNSIRNSLGMLEIEIAREPSRP